MWYKQQAVERKELQKEDAWKRQAQIECEQDHKAAVEAGYRSPEEEEEGEEDGSALDYHVSEADFYGGSTAAAVLGMGLQRRIRLLSAARQSRTKRSRYRQRRGQIEPFATRVTTRHVYRLSRAATMREGGPSRQGLRHYRSSGVAPVLAAKESTR